jgi:prevent-host-death family protein
LDKTVNIHEAKTNLSSLVSRVEAGEGVVIARAGIPVARLVPVKSKKKKRPDRRPGFLKGKIWLGPDFDDPLPDDILAAFRGKRDSDLFSIFTCCCDGRPENNAELRILPTPITPSWPGCRFDQQPRFFAQCAKPVNSGIRVWTHNLIQ